MRLAQLLRVGVVVATLVACSDDTDDADTTDADTDTTAPVASAPAASTTTVQAATTTASTTPTIESTDTLVRIDGRSVEVLDAGGQVVRTIESDDALEFSNYPGPNPDGALIAWNDDTGTLLHLDLESGDVGSIDIGDTDIDVIPWEGPHVALGSVIGGRLLVVELATGEIVDVGAAIDRPDAEIIATGLALPGQHVLPMFDGRTTGVVVVPTDDPADAWVVEGALLDVDGDTGLVVPAIAEPVLSLADRGVVRSGGVPLDAMAIAAQLTSDDHALVVMDDGRLLDADLAAGTTSEVGDLGFEPERAAPLGDARIFVVGTERSLLIDGDGETLREWAAVEGEAIVVARAGAACAVVQPGAEPTSHGDVELIDIASGETVVELGASVTPLSDDGCSVLGFDPGAPELIVHGRRVEIAPRDQVIAVDRAVTAVVLRRREPIGTFLIDLATGDETKLPNGFYEFV